MAAQVAITLMRAGVADASDWSPRSGPGDFVVAILNRFIENHGGAEIRKQFDLYVSLSSTLNQWAEPTTATSPGRIFLTVEPSASGYVEMGKTLKRLSVVEGLPAWFYRSFVGALESWVRVYDYRDALENLEMAKEYYEPEREEDRPEFPDVEGCIPLDVRARPLTTAAVSRLSLRGITGRIVAAMLELVAIRQPGKDRERPNEQELEAFSDAGRALPSLLAVFAKHDLIEAAFDEESANMNEVVPEPNVIIPFDGADVRSTAKAFRHFGVMCKTLALASKIVGMMPGNVDDINTGARE